MSIHHAPHDDSGEDLSLPASVEVTNDSRWKDVPDRHNVAAGVSSSDRVNREVAEMVREEVDRVSETIMERPLKGSERFNVLRVAIRKSLDCVVADLRHAVNKVVPEVLDELKRGVLQMIEEPQTPRMHTEE